MVNVLTLSFFLRDIMSYLRSLLFIFRIPFIKLRILGVTFQWWLWEKQVAERQDSFSSCARFSVLKITMECRTWFLWR